MKLFISILTAAFLGSALGNAVSSYVNWKRY